MKNIFFISIVLFSIPAILYSQNNYYWSKGKRVDVTQSNSKQIFYLKEEPNTFREFNKASNSKSSYSKRVGVYRIFSITSKELIGVNPNTINYISDCFINEYGDTLFPSSLIIVKFKEG